MNDLNVFGEGHREIQAGTVAAAMATTRQAQEVQAAMVVAKRFPRDARESCERILNACQRRSLAEAAVYEYSRGGSTVTGPSIRLAECLAQCWGNIDFGYVELEQKAGESTVMAYAWDLETNTRQSKVFSVPHTRYTKNGSYPLTDPRDIYEMVANQASRRVRSCILAVIPGDVIEAALQQCEKTLKTASAVPLADRIAGMVSAFAEFQISPEMLRGYIGKNVDAFSEADVVKLGKIYRSLKDGIVGSEYFTDRMREAAEAPEGTAVDAETGEVVEAPAKAKQGARGKKTVSLDDL